MCRADSYGTTVKYQCLAIGRTEPLKSRHRSTCRTLQSVALTSNNGGAKGYDGYSICMNIDVMTCNTIMLIELTNNDTESLIDVSGIRDLTAESSSLRYTNISRPTEVHLPIIPPASIKRRI